ncbi:hypothetical protein FW778_13275 [Ginsengibacter hankyongi]|uniref:Uncharacterized protein n=1 Tax=Ginsengibacter hankyongi TaxID=2607284 RepID=A0A5J5IIG1_9BACT|nr:hypothetical protein [Ginsengibacter hankyongi]KAA9038527.1 hypothetical protein FW778_13275 [Ginsengibacter hankyongi]
MSKQPMQNLKLSQLKFEIETCKRLLNFIADENVHLKNRLAEIVKDSFEIDMLGEMENYLSKFVAQDELINLLKNDIAKIEKRLWAETHGDGEIVKDIDPPLRLLQSNILKTEGLFLTLCFDFNNFLVAV